MPSSLEPPTEGDSLAQETASIVSSTSVPSDVGTEDRPKDEGGSTQGDGEKAENDEDEGVDLQGKLCLPSDSLEAPCLVELFGTQDGKQVAE